MFQSYVPSKHCLDQNKLYSLFTSVSNWDFALLLSSRYVYIVQHLTSFLNGDNTRLPLHTAAHSVSILQRSLGVNGIAYKMILARK